MGSTTIGLLLSFTAVAVTVVAVVFDELRDRGARRTKRPQWARWWPERMNVFDAEAPEFRPDQSNASPIVLRPTWVRMAFWNDGHQTILGDDTRTQSPLRIQPLPGVAILEARIVRRTSKGNGLRLELPRPDGSIPIAFAYLKADHGVLIEVVHADENPNAVRIAGELADGLPLQRVRLPKRPWYHLMPDSVTRRVGPLWAHRLVLGQFVFD